MVSVSICFTIYVLNIHHRRPQFNKNMPKIVRKIFLKYLPRILFMKNFIKDYDHDYKSDLSLSSSLRRINSLKLIYTKNALLTKEISSVISNCVDETNTLLLIEKEPKTNEDQKQNPYSSFSKECAQFRNLLVQNIQNLNQINDYLKQEYKMRKVYNFRSTLKI